MGASVEAARLARTGLAALEEIVSQTVKEELAAAVTEEVRQEQMIPLAQTGPMEATIPEGLDMVQAIQVQALRRGRQAVVVGVDVDHNPQQPLPQEQVEERGQNGIPHMAAVAAAVVPEDVVAQEHHR